MKAVEDMLPATQFLRVHRSYIVALRKIRSIDRNSCIYIGNEVIRVTDAYKDAFKLFLDENSL
jgi:DNA-binding LytR/AlgR family response regulator